MKLAMRHSWKALLAAILTLCFAVATVSALTLSSAEGYDQVASKSDMTHRPCECGRRDLSGHRRVQFFHVQDRTG